MTQLISILLGVAVLLGLGGMGGYTLATRHYEPQLLAAADQAASHRTAGQQMQASANRQNAAVASLAAKGEQRKIKAAEAVQAARSAAQIDLLKATHVLIAKPPDTPNLCAAARDAFAAELQDERITP